MTCLTASRACCVFFAASDRRLCNEAAKVFVCFQASAAATTLLSSSSWRVRVGCVFCDVVS